MRFVTLGFFSTNNTPGSPDSWAKAVLNLNSYSRRYSIIKFASALRRIPILFLFFCREYVGNSSMFDFSLDCCFNAVYEGLKFRESSPRCAKSTPHYVAQRYADASPFSFKLRVAT
jgi:hypothetical protein